MDEKERSGSPQTLPQTPLEFCESGEGDRELSSHVVNLKGRRREYDIRS